MDKKGALAVAKQLTTEHLKLSGKTLDEYLNMHFYDTWDHDDVNQTGLIEIERMSQFYKRMLGDQTIEL